MDTPVGMYLRKRPIMTFVLSSFSRRAKYMPMPYSSKSERVSNALSLSEVIVLKISENFSPYSSRITSIAAITDAEALPGILIANKKSVTFSMRVRATDSFPARLPITVSISQ